MNLKKACLFGGTLVAAGAVNGQIILDQTPSDFSNGLISETSPGLEARSADDFDLALGNGQNWNITRLSGVLLTFAQQVPTSGMFEIYLDGGGLPTGSPIYSASADSLSYVGNAFGFPALEFSVGDGVNTLFSAAPGQKLWLSTVGTDAAAGQYFATFNYGGPVNGSQGAFMSAPFGFPNWVGADTQFGGTQSDFAMRVEGYQQKVPAPGAFALLGLGGVVAGRRRRA
jgi:hypothetical protein